MMVLGYFDHYSFRARLQPAFLALLPLIIGALAWTEPGAKWFTLLGSLLSTAGLTFFLANFARNRGKAIEPELWKSWGGAPTTQLLRHSGPANSVLRERWHRELSKLLNKALPTPREEKEDPTGADELYDAATRILIEKTRDTRGFPFIYRDNVNYGFCRNLYALKNCGIAINLLGLIASGLAAYWSLRAEKLAYLPFVCSVICIGLLICWIFTVNSAWVKVPGMNYAHHLLQATEMLSDSSKINTGKRSRRARA
jgi:hypothetical protein